MIRMMNNDEGFIGPVNIGNPTECTIREIAEMIIRLVGNPSATLIEKPLPADDPKQRCPDISLAKEKIGWEPTVPLEEGLRKTIDWFRTIDINQYPPPTTR